MYAIIESCGKQYKVTEGDVVYFEKLDAEEGKKVTFDKVILVSKEGKVDVGAPYVKGVKVEGKVVSHGKGKKIIVYKYKAKKNYRRTQGHRQPYTKVEITTIKRADGQLVQAGNILIRQRGTKIHPGTNVGIGSDDTLYAKVTGTVKFERLGRDKKKVSVYPVEEKNA